MPFIWISEEMKKSRDTTKAKKYKNVRGPGNLVNKEKKRKET